jgi:hypothetical protein
MSSRMYHLPWQYPSSQLRGSCALHATHKDDINPALVSRCSTCSFQADGVAVKRTSEIQLTVFERINV